jgi:hypothetical protein
MQAGAQGLGGMRLPAGVGRRYDPNVADDGVMPWGRNFIERAKIALIAQLRRLWVPREPRADG